MKWFRFYHDAIDDPKVQRLPGELFKFWINLLCLGSRSAERGVISLDVEAIAFATRVTDEDAAAMLADLVQRGLLEENDETFQLHNWSTRQQQSDNVSERVKRHRERKNAQDETLPETLHVTPTETLPETEFPSSRERGEIDTETERDETQTHGADAPERVSDPKPPRYPEHFEVFWRAYPTGHGSKKLAFEQWRKIPAAERQAVMDGLDAWKASDRWQRGFVKDAQRWLRDRQWDDPPPAPPQDPTPLRRSPPNVQTHRHDDEIDYFAGYAPKARGSG
jgi:hypothetical protein